MYNYNCPDCEEAKLQSDKNARKINEVIEQVNTLIDVNNESVDFIEVKAAEKVEEIANVKVPEMVNNILDEVNTEIDNINSSLDNVTNNDIPNITSNLTDIDNSIIRINKQIDTTIFYLENYKSASDESYDNAFRTVLDLCKTVEGYKLIKLPMKDMLLNSTIVIDSSYVNITSENSGEFKPTLLCNFTGSNLFLVQKTGFSLSNVRCLGLKDSWSGNWGELKNTLIKYTPNDVNGVDSLIYNCNFNLFKNGIDCKGRNLRVYDNIFSIIRNCIILDKSTLEDKYGNDIRTIFIKRNHFHGCGDTNPNAAYNTDYILKVLSNTTGCNVVISDNFIDGGTNGLFSGYGNGVKILNNTFSDIIGGNTFIDVSLDSSNPKQLVISGNSGNFKNCNFFFYCESKTRNVVIENNNIIGINISFIKTINCEIVKINNNFFRTTKQLKKIIDIGGFLKWSMITLNYLADEYSSTYGINVTGENTDNLIEQNHFVQINNE